MRCRLLVLVVFKIVIAGSTPAWAGPLTPIFEDVIARTVFSRTPEGLEIGSRILGRRLVKLTKDDFRELLSKLSDGEHRGLVDEVALRLERIKAVALERNPGGVSAQTGLIRQLAREQFVLDSSAAANEIRFVAVAPATSAFASAREGFLTVTQQPGTHDMLERLAQYGSRNMREVKLYAKTFINDPSIREGLPGRYATFELEDGNVLKGFVLDSPNYGHTSTWHIQTLNGEVVKLTSPINQLRVSRAVSFFGDSELAKSWDQVELFVGRCPLSLPAHMGNRSISTSSDLQLFQGKQVVALAYSREGGVQTITGTVVDAPIYRDDVPGAQGKSLYWSIRDELTGEVTKITNSILELRVRP